MIWFQRFLAGGLYAAAVFALIDARTTIDLVLVALMVGFASLSAGLSALIQGQRQMMALMIPRAAPRIEPAEPDIEARPSTGTFVCAQCGGLDFSPAGACVRCGSRTRLPVRK